MFAFFLSLGNKYHESFQNWIILKWHNKRGKRCSVTDMFTPAHQFYHIWNTTPELCLCPSHSLTCTLGPKAGKTLELFFQIPSSQWLGQNWGVPNHPEICCSVKLVSSTRSHLPGVPSHGQQPSFLALWFFPSLFLGKKEEKHKAMFFQRAGPTIEAYSRRESISSV